MTDLDFGSRRKSGLLERDIARLGGDLPPAVPFAIHSLAGALGALYVCEGATLGGRVIAPHVIKMLGGAVPVSFFVSYGDDVSRMWMVCRRVIDQLLQTAADIAEASTVAGDVFDRFAESVR